MPHRPMPQRALFDDAEATPLPELPPDLQSQLLQQMMQWMQAVAMAINEERCDEQDHG